MTVFNLSLRGGRRPTRQSPDRIRTKDYEIPENWGLPRSLRSLAMTVLFQLLFQFCHGIFNQVHYRTLKHLARGRVGTLPAIKSAGAGLSSKLKTGAPA